MEENQFEASGPTLPSPSRLASRVIGLSGSGSKQNRSVEDEGDLEEILILRRKLYIERIVGKRVASFNYMLRALTRETLWMNVSSIDPEDVRKSMPKESLQLRIMQYLYLGLSISKAVSNLSGAAIAVMFIQLQEEFDHYFSSGATQNMKLLMAKTGALFPSEEVEPAFIDVNEPIRPQLRKWKSYVVYKYLCTPRIPFALDYCEVAFSLLEVLSSAYQRMEGGSLANNRFIFASFQKTDAWIQNVIIEEIAKTLTAVANGKFKNLLRHMHADVREAKNWAV